MSRVVLRKTKKNDSLNYNEDDLFLNGNFSEIESAQLALEDTLINEGKLTITVETTNDGSQVAEYIFPNPEEFARYWKNIFDLFTYEYHLAQVMLKLTTNQKAMWEIQYLQN